MFAFFAADVDIVHAVFIGDTVLAVVAVSCCGCCCC